MHATQNGYYVSEYRGYDNWDLVGACPYFDVFSTTIVNWALPEDFYRWNPTGHFVEFIGPKGDDLIRSFCETQEELPCLYIWGHSFELAHIDCYSPERWQGVVKRWDFFEDLCRRISALPDTWYATNIQIVDYVQAMRRAHITPVRIEISSDQTLYFELDGQKTPVAPGASLKL